MSITDQLCHSISQSIENFLEVLKYKILYAKHRWFEDMLGVMLFESQFSHVFEGLTVERCLVDPDYMKRVLEAIESEKKKF